MKIVKFREKCVCLCVLVCVRAHIHTCILAKDWLKVNWMRCVRLEWKQSVLWSCGENEEMSVRRFSPEPKPIHNHSTLERGLIPQPALMMTGLNPAHADTHMHIRIGTQLYGATCIACIKYENTHCLRHRHGVCQGSIKALVFFCADWSQWPDENVILHCVLNGSTWELSGGWGQCKERQTPTRTVELLVITAITFIHNIMGILLLFIMCVLQQES